MPVQIINIKYQTPYWKMNSLKGMHLSFQCKRRKILSLLGGLLVTFIFIGDIKAQDDSTGIAYPKNTVLLQLAGSEGWVSLGYERMLLPKQLITMKVGAGYWYEGYNIHYLVLTASVHKLFQLRNPRKFIDVGAGIQIGQNFGSIFSDKTKSDFFNYTPQVGYRVILKNDIIFRVYGVAIFGEGSLPFAGVSLAKRF